MLLDPAALSSLAASTCPSPTAQYSALSPASSKIAGSAPYDMSTLTSSATGICKSSERNSHVCTPGSDSARTVAFKGCAHERRKLSRWSIVDVVWILIADSIQYERRNPNPSFLAIVARENETVPFRDFRQRRRTLLQESNHDLDTVFLACD